MKINECPGYYDMQAKQWHDCGALINPIKMYCERCDAELKTETERIDDEQI